VFTGEAVVAKTMQLSPTLVRALKSLDEIKALLIEKNLKYGDSVANPKRIFSRASAMEQVLVRIDDKLSRISTMGPEVALDEDTVRDLIGYLALYLGLRDSKAEGSSAALIEEDARAHIDRTSQRYDVPA
jgi:phytoene dehydrogenase-like protein